MQSSPPLLVFASHRVGWLLQKMKSSLLHLRSNLLALTLLRTQSKEIASSLISLRGTANVVHSPLHFNMLLAMTRESVKGVSSIFYHKNLRMNDVDCKLSQPYVDRESRLLYV